MKKILTSLALMTFLSACGGGSSTEKDDSKVLPPPSNSAPTLSGTLTFDAKVASETVSVFTLSDADDDAIALEIIDGPEWLTHNIDNNQLTLTSKPGFFDIASHSVTVTVSDGKDSASYEVRIEVTDNPAMWENLAPVESQLLGYWQRSDTGGGFQLFANGQGLFEFESEVHPMRWEIDDKLKFTVLKPGCVQECDPIEEITVTIVASEENNIRVTLVNAEQTQTDATNLTKLLVADLSNEDFIEHDYYISGGYYKLSTADNFAQLELTASNVEVGNREYSVISGGVHGELTQNSANVFTITNFDEPVVRNMLSGGFFNKRDYGSPVYLEFELITTNVEVYPSLFGNLAYYATFKLNLVSDLNGYAIEDFENPYGEDLPETLRREFFGIDIIAPVTKTSPPELSAGKTYLGSPFQYDTANPSLIEGLKLHLGGVLYQLNTATEGKIYVEEPFTGDRYEQDFSWLASNDSIDLVIADSTINQTFYQLADGSMTIKQDRLNGDSYLYLFEEYINESHGAEQYIGRFKEKSSYIFSPDNRQDYHQFYGDGTGKYGTSSIITQVEENGSLSFVYSGYCRDGDTVSECVERDVNAGEPTVFRNIALHKIVGDEYHFIYTFVYHAEEESNSRHHQSRRIYKKLSD